MVDTLVRPVEWVTDLIDHILYDTSRPTILIVCSTRAKFLEQLAASLLIRIQESRNDTYGEGQLQSPEVQATAVINQPKPPIPLLTKTIGILANSRKVKLVFCPSLEHLRAYLSSLTFGSRIESSNQDTACGTSIAILDLIALHYMSTEFSAQGLLRTLAIAVETAAKVSSSIVLYECEDAVVVRNPNRGQRLWDLHVPILSGANRSQDRSRQVPVRHIVQRWFRFEGEDDDTVGRGI